MAKFNDCGVYPERVEFCGPVPDMVSHLSFYNRIDIALDTFPYNGTTTTCEALWMGVPVVTLLGNWHAARVGYSILSRTGLGSFAAISIEKYIEIASFLSSDSQQLTKLRFGLRSALVRSDLCNRELIVREIETEYKQLTKTF